MLHDLVQVTNLGHPHRKQVSSRRSGRQRFVHTLRISTSRMEWWTCQKIWGMTLFELDNLVNIQCIFLKALLFEVHTVLDAPELRDWARGQSSGK